MKITQSSVSLSSTQLNISSSTISSSLRVWDNRPENKDLNNRGTGEIAQRNQKNTDRISISNELLEKKRVVTEEPEQNNGDVMGDISKEWYGDIKLKIFKDLVEMFTGTKIQVYNPNDDKSVDENETPENQQQETAAQQQDAPQTAGWGIDYQYRETHYTKEGFTMNASGSVETESGKKISFNTSLSMNRESYEELSVSLKAGDALIDPLVIDFNGTGVKMSDQKFKFDLTMDGIEEIIAAPAKGSGFLAYDKNGDGIINDGSELFGPTSGNGFAELAAFDDDKNGWIDENDAIFSSLRIWEKDPDGNDTVSKLLDRNVGAIYTGTVATDFNVIDSSKGLTGAIRQSGIWLNEKTGLAGVISEIDLVA
jgi:hypothetical protein